MTHNVTAAFHCFSGLQSVTDFVFHKSNVYIHYNVAQQLFGSERLCVLSSHFLFHFFYFMFLKII